MQFFAGIKILKNSAQWRGFMWAWLHNMYKIILHNVCVNIVKVTIM